LVVICLLFVLSLFVICLEKTRSQFAKTSPNHTKDEARRMRHCGDRSVFGSNTDIPVLVCDAMGAILKQYEATRAASSQKRRLH
jgi:hypothetical protein